MSESIEKKRAVLEKRIFRGKATKGEAPGAKSPIPGKRKNLGPKRILTGQKRVKRGFQNRGIPTSSKTQGWNKPTPLKVR